MDRIDVINYIFDKINNGIYLEIGVNRGVSFIGVNAKEKIGVDPVRPRLKLYRYLLMNRKAKYYRMTSDTFFENHTNLLIDKGIGVAFVDGLHEYKQSLRDVQNCLKYLRPNGVIIMHDCNPLSKSAAMSIFNHVGDKDLGKRAGAWNGDVWKTVIHLRSTYNDLNIFVLNCDEGLGIITRGMTEKQLPVAVADIDKMTYEELEGNRSYFLNLKNPDYLKELM